MFFLNSLQCIIKISRQMKKLKLMIRLLYKMIHQSVKCYWITIAKVMTTFFFLVNLFSIFLFLVSFSMWKLYWSAYLSLFTKWFYSTLDASGKTTNWITSSCSTRQAFCVTSKRNSSFNMKTRKNIDTLTITAWAVEFSRVCYICLIFRLLARGYNLLLLRILTGRQKKEI